MTMLLLEATPRVIACLLANLKGESILEVVYGKEKKEVWVKEKMICNSNK